MTPSIVPGVVDRTAAITFVKQFALARTLPVRLKETGKRYRPGDNPNLQVEAGQNKFLIVFNIASDGKVQMLDSKQVRDPKGVWSYAPNVVEPYGADYVVAVESDTKLKDLEILAQPPRQHPRGGAAGRAARAGAEAGSEHACRHGRPLHRPVMIEPARQAAMRTRPFAATLTLSATLSAMCALTASLAQAESIGESLRGLAPSEQVQAPKQERSWAAWRRRTAPGPPRSTCWCR